MQLVKSLQPLASIQSPLAMNTLLAALPPEDSRRVSSELTWRSVRVRTPLRKDGDPVTEIYFPGRSFSSVTSSMEDGGVIEVAAIGREGMIGIEAVLEHQLSNGSPIAASGDAIVQMVGDPMAVMSLEAFDREMARRGAFFEVMTRYSQIFVASLMQTVACSGLHSAEQRCCRWLLTAHDRIERDAFPLTHELVAAMLGLRRPTVTLVFSDLSRAGLVAHNRGHVRIVNRTRLEQVACECYRKTGLLLSRLLPPKPGDYASLV
jgi:CRP-like cAMP-binding protein